MKCEQIKYKYLIIREIRPFDFLFLKWQKYPSKQSIKLHDKITEIFFSLNEFCKEFKNEFSKLDTMKLSSDKKPRYRAFGLCDS